VRQTASSHAVKQPRYSLEIGVEHAFFRSAKMPSVWPQYSELLTPPGTEPDTRTQASW